MRLFVYSMRTFDELPFFEKFCAKYNVEYDYTTETPCLENLDMAAGYDVVDVITTVFDKPMLKKLHDLGIKCIATRTIGYDHIDVEYAKELGLGVIHISYSPNSVADYTIMMMLMGCRKMKHIMERAAIQDYTLKGKLGRELPDCTVGIIGTGRIGRTVKDFGKKRLRFGFGEILLIEKLGEQFLRHHDGCLKWKTTVNGCGECGEPSPPPSGRNDQILRAEAHFQTPCFAAAGDGGVCVDFGERTQRKTRVLLCGRGLLFL